MGWWVNGWLGGLVGKLKGGWMVSRDVGCLDGIYGGLMGCWMS